MKHSMEHWKTSPEGQLFDDTPYIKHHYILPNVVEIKPLLEANPARHDDTFDNWRCEATGAEVIPFPQREEQPPQAA